MKHRILASILVLCMITALGLTACQKPADNTTAAKDPTTTTKVPAADETTTAGE